VTVVRLELDQRFTKRVIELLAVFRTVTNAIGRPWNVDFREQVEITAAGERFSFYPRRTGAVIVARVHDRTDQVRIEEQPVIAALARIGQHGILGGDLRACDRRNILGVQRPVRALGVCA
jgi:hypothetical protein